MKRLLLAIALLLAAVPAFAQTGIAVRLRSHADCDNLVCVAEGQVCITGETIYCCDVAGGTFDPCGSAGGGGGGTPGGSNTHVQFNDSSAFGGDAGLTYNKTTDTLTSGSAVIGGGLTAMDPQPVFFGGGSGSTTGRIASITLRDTNTAHMFGEIAFQKDDGSDVWAMTQDYAFADTEDLRFVRKGSDVLQFTPLSATGSDVLTKWTGTRDRYERSGAYPVEFRDLSFTLPDGLWRIVASGDQFLINRNTAVAGDFSTNFSAFEIQPDGDVVIGQKDLIVNSGNIILSAGSATVDGIDVGAHTHGGGTGGTNVPFTNLSGSATDAQIPNTITIDLAAAATALAANGANCSGNNFALGVDASGVGECAQPAFSNLSGTATDAQLASNYSGVGTCSAGAAITATVDNAGPTCSVNVAFDNETNTFSALQTFGAAAHVSSGVLSVTDGNTISLDGQAGDTTIKRDPDLGAMVFTKDGTVAARLFADQIDLPECPTDESAIAFGRFCKDTTDGLVRFRDSTGSRFIPLDEVTSGVGICAAGSAVTTLNENAGPTCSSTVAFTDEANTWSANQNLSAQNDLCFQDAAGGDAYCFQSEATKPAGTTTLTWNIDPTGCSSDGLGGTLTINGSNEIVCAADDSGAGGGTVINVGDCNGADCFVNGTNEGSTLIYEGATIDANQTALSFTGDPGGNFTVTIPNETGTIITTASDNYSGTGSCTNQVVTAVNNTAAPTCSDITTAMIPAGAIAATDLDSSVTTRIGFRMFIENVATTDEFVIRLPPFTGTMTRFDCEAYTGTSFTVNVCDGEDIGDDTCTTSILGGTITCTTAGASTTPSAATGFGARDKVSLVVTAVSGTVNGDVYMTVTVP